MNNKVFLRAQGLVKAKDVDTGEVLIDTCNDIHLENFSEAVALALGGYTNGFIEEMHFGSGGSVVNSTGEISYNGNNANPQNGTASRDADLYGATSAYPTYFKVVNDRSSRFNLINYNPDPDRTNIKISHVVGTRYTDVIVTCTLDYGEPNNQSAFDDSTTVKAKYIFDEIGLKTYDPNTGTKRLLTHVIFNPVQKAANRAIEIVYTIRITMSHA